MDQGKKLATYAQNNIAVYWIVNMIDRQFGVYTGPGLTAIRDATRTGQGNRSRS